MDELHEVEPVPQQYGHQIPILHPPAAKPPGTSQGVIRQRLEAFTAAQIDNALWFLSQDQEGLKPYHRTRTIDY